MFNLTRRINRQTFWLGYVLMLCVNVLIVVIVNNLPGGIEGEFNAVYDVPIFLGFITAFLYGIVLLKQRINDITDKYTFLLFFLAIFLIGPIVGLFKSQQTKNKYGPIPRGLRLID